MTHALGQLQLERIVVRATFVKHSTDRTERRIDERGRSTRSRIWGAVGVKRVALRHLPSGTGDLAGHLPQADHREFAPGSQQRFPQHGIHGRPYADRRDRRFRSAVGRHRKSDFKLRAAAADPRVA
jgi:hypothetical protein